jgi:hypothetical protein
MKIKTKHLVGIALVAVLFIAIYYVVNITGFFIKTSLRNDCGKPLDNFKVIFAYSPNCPHCHNMMPLVEKRNDIYWADVTTDSCKNIVEEFKNIDCNTNDPNPNICPMYFVPTFVCISNKSYYKVGEMTEQELGNWISGCK